MTDYKLKGLFTVVGGVLLNMVAGNLNNWGAISPYVTSYLASENHWVNSSMVYNALPYSFLGENLGVMAAPYLCRKLGIRTCLLVAGLMMGVAYLLCSVISSPHVFIGCYSVLVGVGGGMLTVTSMWPSWDYYPESKGMVTGIIMGGFSSASIVFSFMFTWITNPQNGPPVPNGNDMVFSSEVNNKVPLAFFWVGLVLCGMTCVGVALVRPVSQGSKSESVKKFPVTQILKLGTFWNLFFVTLTSFVFWHFVSGCYKSFGLLYINDDHFLTFVGLAANVSGVLGRWFWPTLLDYLPFKVVLTLSLSYQVVCSGLIWFAVGNKTTYAVLIISLFFATASLFPCAAVQTNKIFGALHDQVWPFVFMAMTVSCVSTILMKFLAETVGYFQVYLFEGFVLLCSVFLTWMLQENFGIGKEYFEPLNYT
mmetsp:Transcript_13953/g.20410  ORF Transcript_13953/g.20410 Transcript_13953/m.20410 type:complete len:423 (-) Transcript_13953:1095-2363(-)